MLGRYDSPESLAEYQRVIAELRATPAAAALVRAPGSAAPAATVAEVLLAFMQYADRRCRGPAGEPTRELTEYRQCVKLVRGLYGHAPAAEFGPLALKAVRRAVIDAGLCRSLIDRRVARVKRVFRWATSEELFPPGQLQALAAVAGLVRGTSEARESDRVTPVADEHVEPVLPFVRPEVAAMVQAQRLTGMRPNEVCRLRPCDVDASGPVWVYRPPSHKTAWRGKPRVIAIGPRAQAVLKPFWPADPAANVFCPRRTVAAMHAARAAARKVPRYPVGGEPRAAGAEPEAGAVGPLHRRLLRARRREGDQAGEPRPGEGERPGGPPLAPEPVAARLR